MESGESAAYRRSCLSAMRLSCGSCGYADECPHAVEDFNDPDLELVWELWTLCRTQMRHGFGGVAGLDYPAAIQTAAVYGHEVTPYDLSGLRALEHDMLCEQADSMPKGKDSKETM